MEKTKKTVCVYHSEDLDGWMSAAIVKHWFEENHQNHLVRDYKENAEQSGNPAYLDMCGWTYGDKIPDLSEYDKVIMVDISFPKEEMSKLRGEKGNNFTWIDHHVSAINDAKEIFGEYYDSFNGFRDTDFAACELTWMYYFDRKESDVMPELIRLLGRYDCFGHKGTDEEQKVLEFQYGAREAISNYKEAYEWLVDGEIELIEEKGSHIYDYLKTEAKQIYSRAFPIELNERVTGFPNAIEFKTRKFLCVNQERFNPINFGIDYHKVGYNGFACFWHKDNKWQFSLYNDNGSVDCSSIAKQYGGGGHAGAAGMVVDTETMLEIING